MAGIILPNGEPFTQLVVQLTVQDAIVWHIGSQFEPAEPEPVDAEPPPELALVMVGMAGEF